MPAFRRFIPLKHAVVIDRMAVTYLGIISGTPNIPFNPKAFLPELVDQPSKCSQQALFHGCSKRTQSLLVNLVLVENALKAGIPCSKCLCLCIRDISQIGFGDGWYCVGRCESIQEKPSVLGNHLIKAFAEISP
ncbi:hypothetical protein RA29_07690 [Tateyamaria sp. ANG-S1]|nr:hypothetical protein RA29_07690 [Tateyamaria sp. ANG-S1]